MINIPINRNQVWLKTALLFGLALYFAYAIVSGNLANYINARFAWLSYVAVALFALLGAASLRDAWRSTSGESPSWPTLLIIAIPLLLGTLVPSRPLGANAVNGDISLNAATISDAVAYNSDPLTWNVLDWLRAFHNADPQTFNGKAADVVGFVYREAGYPADTFMVARFTISCCVADAGAIGLPVRWENAPNLTADTWVRVQGSFAVQDFQADTIPVLHASAVEVVAQPEHPYLYP